MYNSAQEEARYTYYKYEVQLVAATAGLIIIISSEEEEEEEKGYRRNLSLFVLGNYSDTNIQN